MRRSTNERSNDGGQGACIAATGCTLCSEPCRYFVLAVLQREIADLHEATLAQLTRIADLEREIIAARAMPNSEAGASGKQAPE
jgi:hypothetical protein